MFSSYLEERWRRFESAWGDHKRDLVKAVRNPKLSAASQVGVNDLNIVPMRICLGKSRPCEDKKGGGTRARGQRSQTPRPD